MAGLPDWRFEPRQQIASGFDGAVSVAVMAYARLLFVPLSLVLRYLVDAPAGWVFLTRGAAIAVLADWLRRATEQLAERAGSTIGGLLNISFGNTAELILALFVLSRAQVRIVPGGRRDPASGGVRPQRAGRRTRDQHLADRRAAGLGVSVVLLLLYAANLIYTLVTHRDLFAGEAPSGEAEWGVARALLVMMVATAVIAIQAELVSAALEDASAQLGLSPVFLGAVVLALAKRWV